MDSPHTEPELRDWLRWASESGRVPTFVRTIAEAAFVVFRADAAFAKPEIYDAPEEHEAAYATRILANEGLEWEVAEILFRPPGGPSHKPLVRYKSFAYQAGSWTKPRRINAKVEHHPGELFPRAGFVVTNLSLLAYDLGNLWRRLVLPKRIGAWSLTSLPQRLVNTGGRLIKHARYYWLMLAGGHLHRRLFGQMLRRIWALAVPNG